MVRQKVMPGGWYASATPSGGYVVVMTEKPDGRTLWPTHLNTHLQRMELPAPGEAPLFVDCTDVGGTFRLAGQGSTTIEWREGAWHRTPGIAAMSPVMYDHVGALHRIDRAVHNSAQGFRYFDTATNQPVLGEQTVPRVDLPMHEWTDLGDGWYVGQGPGDGCCLRTPEGTFLVLANGSTKRIRAQRDGDRVAVALYVDPVPTAMLLWFTLTEARGAFPVRALDAPAPLPPTAPSRSETTPPAAAPNTAEHGHGNSHGHVTPPTVSISDRVASQETTVPIPSRDEIIAAVTAAKAEVEALGHRFKTVEEAMRDDYAHYTYDDKKLAFLVTLRAAWKLSRTYPEIGLELYQGSSGTPSPFPEDGAGKYSGDIILLTKSGPSCDILIAGVQPAAQVDDTTDPEAVTNWRRDWRPPLNPYRGAVTPAPVPPVIVAPPQAPAPTVDLSAVLARLDAIESALARLEARPPVTLTELPDLEAMGWPTYSGTAKGGWPVGSINFTLTPKETERWVR